MSAFRPGRYVVVADWDRGHGGGFGEGIMRTKLIIIGASYLQTPVVLKAREMGIETHAFAWEDGAVAREHCDFFYPISIVDIDAILAKAREIRPDGIVSIASDLATITVNYVADALGLRGNPVGVTRQTTNKYVMREQLSRHGLPCPRFARADAYLSGDVQELRYPIIVKPTDRSGSRGVTKVAERAELEAAVERATSLSFGKEAIVEEFVEGREISVESISWEGSHSILAITDKVTTGAPHFVETQHHQPANMDAGMREQVSGTVDRALTCLGVRCGAAHSEILIRSDGRLYIVEIGARMGGDCIGSDLVALSTGYDFVGAVIKVALGEFEPVGGLKQACSGVYYLTPPPGRITSIVDRTGDYPEIVKKGVFVRPGDIVGNVTESNDRAGYYIYSSKERFVPVDPPIRIATESVPGLQPREVAG
jgi:biotin carboxylase